MTRGKYAARATLRREDESVRSDLDSYQHTVQRLTAENRDLRDKLAAQKQVSAQEVRRLRSERDEGLSPEVRALRGQLAQAREERDKAKRDAQETLKRWRYAFDVMVAWFKEAYGCTGQEAVEAVLALSGASAPDVVITDHEIDGFKHLNDEEAREKALLIQAARGLRRTPRMGLGDRPRVTRSKPNSPRTVVEI